MRRTILYLNGLLATSKNASSKFESLRRMVLIQRIAVQGGRNFWLHFFMRGIDQDIVGQYVKMKKIKTGSWFRGKNENVHFIRLGGFRFSRFLQFFTFL